MAGNRSKTGEKSQREAILESFIQSAPVAIAMLDREMRYLAVSNQWILDYHIGSDIIGRSHYEVFPEIPDRWKEDHKRCLNGEHLKSMEDSFERLDGRIDWLKWELVPWHLEDSSVGGIIMSTENISAQKSLEGDLRREKDEAEASAKSKDLFIANISHELRTPLNSISGLISLLSESKLEAEQENLVSRLVKSTKSLSHLVDDLLDFSKIEAGGLIYDKDLFLLSDLIEDVSMLFKPAFRHKKVKFRIESDDLSSIGEVEADYERLKQVIVNLLSNAIKFTKQGQVTLGVQVLEDNANKAKLKFWIRDTGIGISEEKRSNIFKVFSQADSSISKVFGGSGLGLSISQKIIEGMNSSIKLESVLSMGSTFSFELDFIKSKELTSDHNHEVVNFSRGRSKEEASILIVDDNADNRFLLKKYLESTSFKVEEASSAKEAIKKYKKNRPSVILMDIQMPEVDGYECTIQIRELEKQLGQRTRIIAVSAHAFGDAKTKAIEAGCNDFISKPVAKADLISVIYSQRKLSDVG